MSQMMRFLIKLSFAPLVFASFFTFSHPVSVGAAGLRSSVIAR
jgi:hypothetical protein